LHFFVFEKPEVRQNKKQIIYEKIPQAELEQKLRVQPVLKKTRVRPLTSISKLAFNFNIIYKNLILHLRIWLLHFSHRGKGANFEV
jgi:hypothetical protein